VYSGTGCEAQMIWRKNILEATMLTEVVNSLSKQLKPFDSEGYRQLKDRRRSANLQTQDYWRLANQLVNNH